MAIATWKNENKLGGVTLMASTAIIATGNQTGVTVGKGKYRLVITISAIDTTGGNEVYLVKVQANTSYATSTWVDITPEMSFSSAYTGQTATAAGAYEIIVDNQQDYQLRIVNTVQGSVSATGITYAAVLYPLASKV